MAASQDYTSMPWALRSVADDMGDSSESDGEALYTPDASVAGLDSPAHDQKSASFIQQLNASHVAQRTLERRIASIHETNTKRVNDLCREYEQRISDLQHEVDYCRKNETAVKAVFVQNYEKEQELAVKMREIERREGLIDEREEVIEIREKDLEEMKEEIAYQEQELAGKVREIERREEQTVEVERKVDLDVREELIEVREKVLKKWAKEVVCQEQELAEKICKTERKEEQIEEREEIVEIREKDLKKKGKEIARQKGVLGKKKAEIKKAAEKHLQQSQQSQQSQQYTAFDNYEPSTQVSSRDGWGEYEEPLELLYW